MDTHVQEQLNKEKNLKSKLAQTRKIIKIKVRKAFKNRMRNRRIMRERYRPITAAIGKVHTQQEKLAGLPAILNKYTKKISLSKPNQRKNLGPRSVRNRSNFDDHVADLNLDNKESAPLLAIKNVPANVSPTQQSLSPQRVSLHISDLPHARDFGDDYDDASGAGPSGTANSRRRLSNESDNRDIISKSKNSVDNHDDSDLEDSDVSHESHESHKSTRSFEPDDFANVHTETKRPRSDDDDYMQRHDKRYRLRKTPRRKTPQTLLTRSATRKKKFQKKDLENFKQIREERLNKLRRRHSIIDYAERSDDDYDDMEYSDENDEMDVDRTHHGTGIETEFIPYSENVAYEFYDDPNELCDRLRLLIASRAAGNSNHAQEINSLIAELRESGYIK